MRLHEFIKEERVDEFFPMLAGFAARVLGPRLVSSLGAGGGRVLFDLLAKAGLSRDALDILAKSGAALKNPAVIQAIQSIATIALAKKDQGTAPIGTQGGITPGSQIGTQPTSLTPQQEQQLKMLVAGLEQALRLYFKSR